MRKIPLSTLKKLSAAQCRQMYHNQELTRFEYKFNEFLTGEIDWPEYTGFDVVKLRERLHLTQGALAAILKVSVKSVSRWEVENAPIPGVANIALCMLDKLESGVFDVMDVKSRQFELRPVRKNKKKAAPEAIADVLLADKGEQKRPVPDPFDGQAVRSLRQRMQMTRREFAGSLGVSLSSVDKWESGEVALQGSALTLLKILWQQGTVALPDFLPNQTDESDQSDQSDQ